MIALLLPCKTKETFPGLQPRPPSAPWLSAWNISFMSAPGQPFGAGAQLHRRGPKSRQIHL